MSVRTDVDTAHEPTLKPALPFSVALGHRLRQVREERQKTAVEVAKMSRIVGLNLDRATLIRIELGQRQVSVADLLLLAALYGAAVAELLPTEAVQLSEEAGASPQQLRAALTAAPAGWELPRLQHALPGGAGWKKAWARIGSSAKQQFPGAALATVMAAAADARDEADQTVKDAARRLNVSPEQVRVAARHLWDQTLTGERDRRVAVLGGATSARAKQARRGHVTRALLAELAPVVDQVRTGSTEQQEASDVER